jgi:NAD(P)H-nitrite reductase large subunit
MYIIIGQGAAGSSAAKTLRRLDPATPVTMITDEQDYFYSRIDLPDIVAGKFEAAESELQGADAFRELGIVCRMHERVTAIHPDEKTVELASGERHKYSKLLLATGSLPVIPPLPGREAKGVYALWTMAQTREIAQAAQSARSAVVIGAGLIGLKSALALAARGLEVTVVEKLSRVMPRQLDDTAANVIADAVCGKGVALMLGAEVKGITTSKGAVTGVQLEARELACEMVLMAVGVKPNVELAQAAGIEVGRGIIVDPCQQTSVADIYAAGDVAETIDPLTGNRVVPAIWPVAVEQGEVAACNMTGTQAEFKGSVAMNAIEIAGIPLVSIGDFEGEAGDEVLTSGVGASYRKLVLRGNRLRGVLCLGDIRQAGVIGSQVLRQAEVNDASSLISPHFNFACLVNS